MGNVRQSIEQDVASLCAGLSREVGTHHHDVARGYITGRLAELGVDCAYGESYDLPYECGELSFTNILGRVPGINANQPPVLLGAHYDTVWGTPGADDNAAGVAILLAVAEDIRNQLPDRDVLFAFFDAEEPPYFQSPAMGSTVYYQTQRSEDIHCAIILDLVGHDVPMPGLEDLLFILGMESDSGLESVFESCEPPPGVRVVPTLNKYIGDMSDHHIFRENERPYMLLTCGRWDHYHEPTDTPEVLNTDKMAAIASYVRCLATGASGTRFDGPFEGYDSTGTELRALRQHIQPFLDEAGIPFKLEGRRDIYNLVNMLTTHFRL